MLDTTRRLPVSSPFGLEHAPLEYFVIMTLINLWVWFIIGVRWYHLFRTKYPGEKIDKETVWFGAFAVTLYGGYLTFLWARELLPRTFYTEDSCEKLGKIGSSWLVLELWSIWMYYWIKHYKLNKALDVVPSWFSWLWFSWLFVCCGVGLGISIGYWTQNLDPTFQEGPCRVPAGGELKGWRNFILLLFVGANVVNSLVLIWAFVWPLRKLQGLYAMNKGRLYQYNIWACLKRNGIAGVIAMFSTTIFLTIYGQAHIADEHTRNLLLFFDGAINVTCINVCFNQNIRWCLRTPSLGFLCPCFKKAHSEDDVYTTLGARPASGAATPGIAPHVGPQVYWEAPKMHPVNSMAAPLMHQVGGGSIDDDPGRIHEMSVSALFSPYSPSASDDENPIGGSSQLYPPRRFENLLPKNHKTSQTLSIERREEPGDTLI